MSRRRFRAGATMILGTLTAWAAGCTSSRPVEQKSGPLCPAGDAGTWTTTLIGPPADGAVEGGAADACGGGIVIAADRYFVAEGLCVRALATHQGPLRQITFAPNGDLFGVTTEGAIRRYRDSNGDGAFDRCPPETLEWADTGGSGNNVHIDAEGGFLYAGTKDGVKRWPYAPDAKRGGDGEVFLVGEPGTGNHLFHTVHVYDGFAYVQSGSEGNVSAPASPDYDPVRSVIRRFPLAGFDPKNPFQWKDGEVFASGLRNTVGFTRQASGALFGVVNGIDDLEYGGVDVHESNPADMILRLESGGTYGYPYCFTALDLHDPAGALLTPGTQLHTEVMGFTNPHDDAWCTDHSREPAALLDAHSAPLDLAFLEQETAALPARWVGGAFVALHGSWDRRPTAGYKVVWVPFDAAGKSPLPTVDENGVKFPYELVFSGKKDGVPIDGPWSWQTGKEGEDLVRPVGVAVSPVDGALYFSSDNGSVLKTMDDSPEDGALYRIALPRR